MVASRRLPRIASPLLPLTALAVTPAGDRGCKNRPAVLLAAGIVTAQDHSQGRLHVADAMARAPPMTMIFPGKLRRLSGGREIHRFILTDARAEGLCDSPLISR